MTTPRVWALMGRRTGDNRQIAALAEAAGLSWEPKPLSFEDLTKRVAARRAGSLRALDDATRGRLAPPWPDVVIAAGRWSSPVALWIKAASGETTKIVHIGRPWAPLAWFDLVVTTPQYGLPARANVLANRLPLTAASPPAEIDGDLAALPRPRLAVIVGGASPPRSLDATAARDLAATAIARLSRNGGSLLVATSPRTSAEAVAALRAELTTVEAPVRLSVFGEEPNRYRAFLGAADSFLATDDSAAMVAEAAMAGAPVELFALPQKPSAAQRRVRALRTASARTAATRALFDRLVDWGVVTSVRDLDLFFDGLRSADLLAGDGAARALAERELAEAARRVRRLADEREPR